MVFATNGLTSTSIVGGSGADSIVVNSLGADVISAGDGVDSLQFNTITFNGATVGGDGTDVVASLAPFLLAAELA